MSASARKVPGSRSLSYSAFSDRRVYVSGDTSPLPPSALLFSPRPRIRSAYETVLPTSLSLRRMCSRTPPARIRIVLRGLRCRAYVRRAGEQIFRDIGSSRIRDECARETAAFSLRACSWRRIDYQARLCFSRAAHTSERDLTR